MKNLIIAGLSASIWNGGAMAAWSSGGGSLIKDSGNPWFIQNTKVVKYCILIDQVNVNISESEANSAITEAINYWKEEFSFASLFYPSDGVKIATQKFEKSTCTLETKNQVDLVFQLGILDQKQRDYIRNVGDYAAISVRTAYDKKILRGKGFIYFAAENGDDKPKNPGMVDHPWTSRDNALLMWTAIHELGHVFGLAHNSKHPGSQQVMSHRFVDHILQKKNADDFYRESPKRQYFRLRPDPRAEAGLACTFDENYLKKAKAFFGIPEDWFCLGTKLIDEGMEIWGAASFEDIYTPTKMGTINFGTSFNQTNPAGFFWLPPEQTVFPGKNHVDFPEFYSQDIPGVYASTDGNTKRKLGLSLNPKGGSPLLDDLRISGEMDGKFYVNLIEGT